MLNKSQVINHLSAREQKRSVLAPNKFMEAFIKERGRRFQNDRQGLNGKIIAGSFS